MNAIHYEFIPGDGARLVNAHWEHGHRVHGLWCNITKQRLGAVGIGPPGHWDGTYGWYLDHGRAHTDPEREETTLARAKKATEELLISRELLSTAKPANLPKVRRMLAQGGFHRNRGSTTPVAGSHDRQEGLIVFKGHGCHDEGSTQVGWRIGNMAISERNKLRISKDMHRIMRYLIKNGVVVVPSREIGPCLALLVFEADSVVSS